MSWLFAGIGFVASRAREGLIPLHILNVIVSWFLGPGYGGFLALFATPRIINGIKTEVLFAGFVSSMSTLGVIILTITWLLSIDQPFNFMQIALLVVQFGSMLAGAKAGELLHKELYEALS